MSIAHEAWDASTPAPSPTFVPIDGAAVVRAQADAAHAADFANLQAAAQRQAQIRNIVIGGVGAYLVWAFWKSR